MLWLSWATQWNTSRLKILERFLGRSVRCVLKFPALNLQQTIILLIKPFLCFISSLPRQAFLSITRHCHWSQFQFHAASPSHSPKLCRKKPVRRFVKMCRGVAIIKALNSGRQFFHSPPSPGPLVASPLIFADHVLYNPIPEPTKMPATQSIETADRFCFLLKSEISLLHVVGQLSS